MGGSEGGVEMDGGEGLGVEGGDVLIGPKGGV